MINRIIKALEKSEVEHYLIHENTCESAELFLIKKRIDMCREKKTTDWSVTVYRDFMAEKDGKPCAMRGASDFGIFPGMTDSEIEASAAAAFRAAAYVKNPYYELIKGTPENSKVTVPGPENGEPLAKLAAKMAQALTEADHKGPAFLNSAEIFAERIKERVLNSEGVDASYEKRSIKGEFVVQCKEPQDVEMYHSFRYEDADTEALTRKTVEALVLAEQRARAVSAPKSGTYPVLLANDEVGVLFDYYFSRSSSSMIYPKYSNYAVGTKAQGEEIRGDAVSMELRAEEPFSYEGIPMRDRELMRDGEIKLIHGPARFGYYLGIEPTGKYSGVRVAAGSRTMDELGQIAGDTAEAWLEVKSFSDFQMDEMSGYFGGEIRLALLHEKGRTTPVTGGSINGSLLAAQRELYLSKETIKSRNYEGPKAVLMTGISVAGRDV